MRSGCIRAMRMSGQRRSSPTSTALVEQTDPVAIGEIGLDYYWTQDNKAVQRTSFERQIELACSRQVADHHSSARCRSRCRRNPAQCP